MTNLFSKISSQNGTLKLFAGGRQIKSLVPLIDVARCFKFMEERNDINKELFNLTKDKVTVKDVAQICKKYNPKIKGKYIKKSRGKVNRLNTSMNIGKLKKII